MCRQDYLHDERPAKHQRQPYSLLSSQLHQEYSRKTTKRSCFSLLLLPERPEKSSYPLVLPPCWNLQIYRWRWQQRRVGMSDPVLRNFQGKWRHQFFLSAILVMWNLASLCQTIHLDFLFGASGVYTGNSQGPSGDRHREICLKKTGYKSLFFRWANIAFY